MHCHKQYKKVGSSGPLERREALGDSFRLLRRLGSAAKVQRSAPMSCVCSCKMTSRTVALARCALADTSQDEQPQPHTTAQRRPRPQRLRADLLHCRRLNCCRSACLQPLTGRCVRCKEVATKLPPLVLLCERQKVMFDCNMFATLTAAIGSQRTFCRSMRYYQINADALHAGLTHRSIVRVCTAAAHQHQHACSRVKVFRHVNLLSLPAVQRYPLSSVARADHERSSEPSTVDTQASLGSCMVQSWVYHEWPRFYKQAFLRVMPPTSCCCA